MLKRCLDHSCLGKAGRVTFIFLFLLLLATFATAFHYHLDNNPHPDCPLCMAGHRFTAESSSSFSLEIYQANSIYGLPQETSFYNSAGFILLPSRASPA